MVPPMAETLVDSDQFPTPDKSESCSAVEMNEEKGGSGDAVASKPDGTANFKADIDTSAPFESVKEAVSRFGGAGFWKSGFHHRDDKLPSPEPKTPNTEDIDITKVEEQAAELEKELFAKERDTLQVLKELEATKRMVEELRSKLQNAESAMPSSTVALDLDDDLKGREEEKENESPEGTHQNSVEGQNSVPLFASSSSSAPGLILMELKQAKLNLSRTTADLAEIRASVESYNKKIEKERKSLGKTRERLSSNSLKISSLEEELSRTKLKLQLARDCERAGEGNSQEGSAISAELQRLNCEAEKFRKVGEAAKAEAVRVMSEIEQTKAKIKTTEIRLIAAQKMKEAARAAEAVALAEMKALQKSKESEEDAVTLTYEEYSSLTFKAKEADENCKKRVEEATNSVDEANSSKMDILKRVEEAMEGVKTSKKALEEALRQVEAANQAKLAVEDALRRWRADHGQRRKSFMQQSSTKFKVTGPTNSTANLRRDSIRMLDVNGVTLVNNNPSSSAPVLKSTLSIGQILSRKLLVAEEYELSGKNSGKRKVSLGQMLGKQNGELLSSWKLEKENGGHAVASSSSTLSATNTRRLQLPAKRKKFGFARFSMLLTKQRLKKKRPSFSSILHDNPC